MNHFESLWHERYGSLDGVPPAEARPSSDYAEHLLAHRSVRAFTDEPLAPGTLELLIAAAQSAPSSSNLQAWSVVAVEDAARKARLAEWAGHQAHVKKAPLVLAWIADLSRLDRSAQRIGAQAGANEYLEMFLIAAVDAALAAQNALSAAESLGLGTVYLGALRNHPIDVAQELKLPPNAFAVFGLCVGHPDASRPASVKPRLPQRAVLHRETYDSTAEASAVGRYDDALQVFQRGQGMTVQPWSRQASQRVAGPGSMVGRDKLAAQLKALGFGLK